MTFNALVVEKDDEGKTSASVQSVSDDRLPEGNVTVAVEYSTVNYKDGLCLGKGGGGLVREYPHVGGIDFAGTVESSDDDRYKPGDKVVLTGPMSRGKAFGSVGAYTIITRLLPIF